MTRSTAWVRRALVVALGAVWLVVPAALMVAQWPQWWTWIAAEQTPMTWLQSVVLVLAAAGSLLTGYLLHLTRGDRLAAWWVLAAGFGALAVDERFALHERVRDGILAPRGVSVPFLPWVAPGDFIVMLIALVGLALLPMVWRAVRPDAGARNALLLGVALAVIAVAADSIDPSTWTTQAERVEQTGEEVVELASWLALLASVGLRMLGLLGSAVGKRDAEPATTDVTAGASGA